MNLVADHIMVHRGPRAVLCDISARIDSAGCIAVVGPNGAGKTTLLQALLGLLVPVAGVVRLDGRDVRSIRRREIARRMAYVPQSVDGLGGFTVEQVVAAGRFPHRHPLEPLNNDDGRIIQEALRACGLHDLSGRPLDTLSGGERQKVWIAAALAQDTAFLLLDEPAASLDPKHQAELIALMRSLAAGGKTILLVAHDLNFAGAAADRVIALRNGRIAFDGAPAGFFQTDTLGDVFDAAFDLTAVAGRARPYANLRA